MTQDGSAEHRAVTAPLQCPKDGAVRKESRTMPRYKWDNPQEWLMEKAAKWNAIQLFQEFQTLVLNHVDADTIQDLYQSDMSADGYFRDLDAKAPVILILDENGEATDTVWFCSSTCRNLYYTTTTDIDLETTPHKEGESGDFEDGTVCDHCGKEIDQ